LDSIAIGKHNPQLNQIRKAINHGVLTEDGLLPVEGPKLIREAGASGLQIVALFVRHQTPFEQPGGGIPVYTVDAQTFKKIQSTETSQGIVALVRTKKYTLRDLVRDPQAILLVLAGLQDPGNVGTIFRIAESFGAAGCIGLAGTTGVYNPKVVRASAGSLFRVPHVWNAGLVDVLAMLGEANIPLVGTSPHAESTTDTWDWRKGVAILVGNEGRGLHATHTLPCNAVLRIPHKPEVESLNSAIAAAVILYEAFKQRGAP
jgi:TrmH family RNA methyltransferase